MRRVVIGIGAFLAIYLVAAYLIAPFIWKEYATDHPSFDDNPRHLSILALTAHLCNNLKCLVVWVTGSRCLLVLWFVFSLPWSVSWSVETFCGLSVYI